MPLDPHPGGELLDTLTQMVGDAVFTHGKSAKIRGKFTRNWMILMDGYVSGLTGMPVKHAESDRFTFAGYVFNIVEQPGVKGIIYLDPPPPGNHPKMSMDFSALGCALDAFEGVMDFPVFPSQDPGEFDVEGMN